MSYVPLLLSLLACRGDKDTTTTPEPGFDPYDVVVGPYDADIQWTSYGIPHITAEGYGSLGYGMGYAFARDHACVLADQIVMVRSERSRYFGEEWLDMDFGWLALDVRVQAEAGWPTLDPDIQAAIIGYAAGYSRFIDTETPDARCAGGEWVKPIDHIDLLSYYLALGLYGSGAVFVEELGGGTPPDSTADSRGGEQPPAPGLDVLRPLVEKELGSNGWAIGSERSESGGGMLLSNTHFPAEGERKWHESHLTIPGELDIYGASLMGVAIINVGFNADIAWTHTVSNAPRFNGALLQLEEGAPTRYLYDGAYEDMTSRSFSVEVAQADGTTEAVSRTLYSSRWGPVMNAPVLGWNELYALALVDANANNLAMLDAWFSMSRAQNMADFQAAHRDLGGIPWVHTLATDTAGTAFYVDSSTVPRWSDAAESRYPDWLVEQPLAALFDDNGAKVIDGSDPLFVWESDPDADAWRPDVVPWADMPRQERTDFVFNANDNHWLSNPDAPLEGYPLLYGDERTPRTPRTRMNARYLSEPGSGGEDGRFSLAELQAAALGGRGILADDLRAEVVSACEGVETVELDDTVVDITVACAALASWDGTVSPDQVGAAVWRELLGSGEYTFDDLKDAGLLFSTPFDPNDPVDTPRDLSPDGPLLEAMAQAVVNLDAAGFSPDVSLEDIQFTRKDGRDIPILGGQDYEGVVAIATYSGGNATLLETEPRATVLNDTSDLTADGYQINYGNSFVMTVDMGGDSPTCEAIMTYSQSDDPDSPHFDDQTLLYRDGLLRPCLFTAEDVAADVVESMVLTLE
ncbi:MAG: acyl-homoserine-lactone acylase [Myxococcota bacterium]